MKVLFPPSTSAQTAPPLLSTPFRDILLLSAPPDILSNTSQPTKQGIHTRIKAAYKQKFHLKRQSRHRRPIVPTISCGCVDEPDSSTLESLPLFNSQLF
jgi:hypothetical protein